MFRFFRRYQKGIFLVVTGVIAVTFLFFGSFDLISKMGGEKKVVVTKDPFGKDIYLKDIDDISFFLMNERSLLKGSLLKEMRELGITRWLFSTYFKEDHFLKKFQRIKNYKHYRNNINKEISLERTLEKFFPDIYKKMEKVRSFEKFNLEAFEALEELYFENRLKEEDIKKLVLLQLNLEKLPMEEAFRADYKIFGLSTLSDWFSKEFVEMLSQLIITVNRIARSEGFRIEDVDVELEGRGLFDKRYLKNREFFNILKEVALFKKYIGSVEDIVFLDDICHREIAKFKKRIKVKKYSLKDEFILKGFLDLLKLKTYKNYTMEERWSKKLPIDVVEREAKALIGSEYTLEISHVNLDEIALEIGERELWKWQTDKKNWDILNRQFFLSSKEGLSKEEMFSILDGKKGREGIDSFSRRKMIGDDLIDRALSLKEAERKEVSLSFFDDFLKGVETKVLIDLLDREDLKGDWKRGPLYKFSENGDDYYRIKLISRGKRSVIPFKKAKENGALDYLLDSYLLINSSNTEEEIKRDREGIARDVFSSFLGEIDRYRKGRWVDGKGPMDHYVETFMEIYLKEGIDGRVKGQWQLKEIEEEFEEGKAPSWMRELGDCREFSDIKKRGKDPFIYRFISLEEGAFSKDAMRETWELLLLDAKREFISKKLKKIEVENLKLRIRK